MSNSFKKVPQWQLVTMEMEQRLLTALAGPNPDIVLAMCVAADSNIEKFGVKFVKEGAQALVRRDDITLNEAVRRIFETAWNFLMRFSDEELNRNVPRVFFGGLVWGILLMKEDNDITPYIRRVVFVRGLPQFRYEIARGPEAEISDLVRQWTLSNKDEAQKILAEVREKEFNPTSLAQIMINTMIYGLMADMTLAQKINAVVPPSS